MDNIMSLEEFRKIEQNATRIDRKARDSYTENFAAKKRKEDYYRYTPFGEPVELFNAFSLVKKNLEDYYESKRKLKFLDVGAGTGRIVKIAEDFGFDAFGIEYDEKYIKAGRKAFGLSEKELFQKDGFDIDRKFLEDVDIIYTYMPVSNKELMAKLHCQLYSKAMYNTIFLEMFPVYYPANVLVKSKANLANGNTHEFGSLAIKKL